MSDPGFNLEDKSCSGLMKYAGFDHWKRRDPPREPDTEGTFSLINNSTANQHGMCNHKNSEVSKISTKGPSSLKFYICLKCSLTTHFGYI